MVWYRVRVSESQQHTPTKHFPSTMQTSKSLLNKKAAVIVGQIGIIVRAVRDIGLAYV